MVRRPQPRRSAVTQFITHDIGVQRARTAAEQHEIEPTVEIDRRVEQVCIVAPGVAQIPRVSGAPGILEASPDEVVVSRRARTIRPGIEVTSQDYRQGGVGRPVEDLVALSNLDCIEWPLLLQMCVDESECLPLQRHIYRTPSA